MDIFGTKRLKEVKKMHLELKDKFDTQSTVLSEITGKMALQEAIRVNLFDSQQTDSFKNFLMQLDKMQNLEYVADINLDGTDINRYEFADFAYRHGCVMIVFDNQNKKWLYGKPKADSWDFANNINDCTLILQRYDSIKDEYDDYPSKSYKKGDYFLFYDTAPTSYGVPSLPRLTYNEVIINQMAEIFARMNINITLATNKLYIEAPDANTHALIKKEFDEQYGSRSPFIISTKGKSETETPKAVPTPAQNSLTEMFALIKQYDQIRQMYNGIGQGQYGIDKQERNLADEVSVNTDSVDFCHRFRDNQKSMLSIWIKMVNEKVMNEIKDTEI